MSNFTDMGKLELRVACKEAGIKGYGKMDNAGMRAALDAHYTPDEPVEAVVEVPVPAGKEITVEVFDKVAPVPQNMWTQLLGGNGDIVKKVSRAPTTKNTGLKIEKDREERNGIKKPSIGGTCRAVWDAMDLIAASRNPTAKDVKALAEQNGWNPNNASIEFYQWRKFNGIRGRQV